MTEIKSRKEYLPFYFPDRKGVKRPFYPIEDIHYEENSLAYTTSRPRALEMFNEIAKFYGNNKFVIIDVHGNIGGSALTFLESDQTELVICFEKELRYANMLRRNINAYGFGNKAIVYPIPFTEATHQNMQAFTGAAVFLDPPFLDESVDPKTYVGDITQQYIKQGMKMGNLTLEEHLAYMSRWVYVCGMHLPVDYKLNMQLINQYGWVCGTMDGKCPMEFRDPKGKRKPDFYVFYNANLQQATQDNLYGYGYFKNNYLDKRLTVNYWVDPEAERVKQLILERQKEAVIHIPASTVKINPIALDESYLEGITKPSSSVTTSSSISLPSTSALQQFSSQSQVTPALPIKVPVAPRESKSQSRTSKTSLVTPYVDPNKNWERFSKSLPIYVGTTPGDLAWIKEFQVYIYTFLRGFITDEAIRKRMVDAESMKKWIKTFSHESYNKTYNYESIETVGDALLSYAFKKFLIRNHNGISPNDMTNYTHHYLAKNYMGNILGRSMKIHRWALVGKGAQMNKSIVEDITEAMLTTLDDIADSIQDGLGALIAYKLVSLIFSDVELDPKIARGPDKTLLDQYSSRLALPPRGIYLVGPETGIDQGENKIKFEYRFSDEMAKYLRDHRFNINPENTVGYGPNTTVAKANAVANTMKALDAAGFTNEYVTEQAEIINVRKFIDDYETYANLMDKVQRQHPKVTRLSFRVEKPPDAQITVYLYGIDKKGKLYEIYRKTGIDENDIKRDLIREYLQ